MFADPISNLDSSSNTPAHPRPAGTAGDQTASLFDEATANLGSQTTQPATTPNSTSQLTQSVTTAAVSVSVSESSKSKSNSSTTVDESTTPLAASNVDSTSD